MFSGLIYEKKIMKPGFHLVCMTLLASTVLPAYAGRLKVVSTTSILGDVVRQVAGDQVEQIVIMPPGIDPHHFEPSAKDMANLADASVIFMNGLGLESFMERQIRNLTRPSGKGPILCAVSDGIALAEPAHQHHDHEHEHEGVDPHVWTDPMNVVVWVDTIARTLSELDPEQLEFFLANADAYKQKLLELDAWISETVSAVPEEKRQLVTDHDMLKYFSARYGFQSAGFIMPSYSTAAEPSARALARLHRVIKDLRVRTIFIAFSSNPQTADRLARDTGVTIVPIYSGTLGGPGSGVEHYIDYMKYNTRAIVDGLTGGHPTP